MTEDELATRDQRTMRRLFYVLFIGILLIWTGLLSYGKYRQVVGVLICLGGFVWIAFGGWRVMSRCATRLRSGQ